MKKSKFLALVLATVMAAMSFGGCGGFTGDGSSTTTTPPADSSSTTTPTDDKKTDDSTKTETPATTETTSSNDVLTIYDSNEIRTMIQWAASDSNTSTLTNNAFEGLYRLDKNHEPQPALAESYELSEDGLVYTFHLRDGLQWSNGTPLTANDFVFAWLKQMSAEATNGYSFIMTDYIVNGEEYLAGAAAAEDVGVKAVDDKTLQVTLKQPTPYFLRLTVLTQFFPLNEEFVTAQGDQYGVKAENMLYCGPYVVQSYDAAAGSRLVKNDKYWDAASVKIPTVDVKIIKEQATALNAYKAGEISQVVLVASDVPAFKDDPEFTTRSEFRTTYLQFNTQDPAVSNVNIRKALSYAIDREILTGVILSDGSAPAEGLIANDMAGDGSKSFRELNGNLSPFDAEKAKEYWDKGVEELGSVPSISLLVADDSVTKTVATFLQSQFKSNLGIDVTIDGKTAKARNELMDTNKYQMAVTAWGADYDDAMTYLDLWVMTPKEGNEDRVHYDNATTAYRGNWVRPEYDQMIRSAKVEANTATRLQTMLDAEKMIVEEDVVVSPLYYRGFAYLTKSNVKDLVRHPFGPPIEFKYAYFE